VEDVVWVVESVRYGSESGVGEDGGGGERRALKGVVDGRERSVRSGVLVYV
jgi:hypothetical protein